VVGAGNRIGDVGAAEIADILTKHPKLLVLHLDGNQIGVAGCIRVADVLLNDVESLMNLWLHGAWRLRA